MPVPFGPSQKKLIWNVADGDGRDGIGRDRYSAVSVSHERNIFSIVLYITKLNSEPIQYLV